MGSSGFVISDNPNPTAGGWVVSDSPTPSKPIDNGIPTSGTTGPRGPQTPGFWGTIGHDIAGIPHTVANFGRLTGIRQTPESFNQAYQETIAPNVNLVKQGADEIANGQWLGGPVHMLEGLTPGVGPMTHLAAQDIEHGHTGAGLARIAEIGMPSITHEIAPLLPDEIPAPIAKAGAVVKGAGKGAWEGGTTKIPINLRRYGVGVKFGAPAPVIGGALGAEAGGAMGLPFGMAKPGAVIGGAAGALAPIVKGAIKGGKAAAADFDASSAITKTPRPDYSDLISTPWNNVPPYSSSVTPESGATARALGARPITTRPSPGSSSIALQSPSGTVPWVGQPITPETAPVPPASSYVATPSSGRLVEPWKSNQIIPIETPGASSDIAGIHPDDLDAAASLMTNGRKAFADLKGTTRTEAIQRAHQFSANRAGIQPIAAQPASNPVAPNLQSEILPATEDIPTPVPFSGTKGTASTIGSNVGVADDTTAKIHNLYDYLATQRAELTPEILKKVANGEAVRVGDDWITQNEIQQKAADWARSQGRQAPKLTKQNPTGAYQSFDYVNQRKGGRGTAAEVIDMLTGKQPQAAHARPSGGVNTNGQTLPNYGPLPQSPHAGIKPIQ